METITINPIGIVHSDYLDPDGIPKRGHISTIEVFPAYEDALHRIQEHSHLWILTWFHLARRDHLRTIPARVDPHAPEYGVFGLRCAKRPNPVAMSLVWLESIRGNILTLRDFDALDGSPVVDIKPYFENDVVFSPRAPYIRPKNPEMCFDLLYKRAYKHHQEECLDMLLGLRLAMVAEGLFGRLNYPELKLAVQGSPCLADTLQGLFNARFANPTRFTYREKEKTTVRFWDGRQELQVSVQAMPPREELLDLTRTGFMEIVIG